MALVWFPQDSFELWEPGFLLRTVTAKVKTDGNRTVERAGNGLRWVRTVGGMCSALITHRKATTIVPADARRSRLRTAPDR
jgi:hypothetical protein